ncbi:MAG: alpha-E domain-containing protein [Bacteroidota bacterium]
MLSRVANSVYWLNRYIERAENYARFISVNFNLALDLPPNLSEQWEPLLIATADDYIFKEFYKAATPENVIQYMSFDVRNPNSILSSLQNARENARTIRESISKEMWEHVNQFYWMIKEASAKSKNWDLNKFQSFFDEIKMGCQLFFGIVDSTISRNEGWHFGRMGRMLERADKTTRFLDVKYFILLPNAKAVGSPLDLLLWSAVLKSVSAYNMFRQKYTTINPSNIAEYLLLDKYFPRSILYCMRYAETSLYEISGNKPNSGFSNEAEKQMGRLKSMVEYTDINDIFEVGLHKFLDDFQTKNNKVADAIYQTYFDLKPIETVH